MTCSTSEVAASCSSASSRSRVRRSSCSCRWQWIPVRSALCEPWAYCALTLYRLSASTASLHVARLRRFTTMLNPMQIPASAPRQDVRFGSIADIVQGKRHVRFTSDSGQFAAFQFYAVWPTTITPMKIRTSPKLKSRCLPKISTAARAAERQKRGEKEAALH